MPELPRSLWIPRTSVAPLLAAPVDAASLAAFRVLFGVMMAAGTARFVTLGWVRDFYILPTFHFTWELFPWVQPLPGGLMYLLFAALFLCACGVALGFHYRGCITLFFAGFTYVELLDKTTYLNHYYLVSLLAGLLIFLPADGIWSVDSWRGRIPMRPTIPAWTVNLLRFQLAVVFVFAGLAKINADWLLAAQPLRIWLAARSDLPIVGPFLAHVWAPYAFSWFGAFYDLTIVFFLLWTRTRAAAYLTVIVFHTMTALLFPIGMFPWIMIVATLIFFPPDWPRAWLRIEPPPVAANRTGGFVVPARVVVALTVYAAIQIIVPLRSYWPGSDPEWTYRGFNFAWRVMLAEKTGYTELVAFDPATGHRRPIRLRDYVTERQEKMMAQDPYMVRALARHIAADLRSRGVAGVAGPGGVEVRAESYAALNGRPVQRLIDPHVDLAGPALRDWIVPLRRDGAVDRAGIAVIDNEGGQ